MKPRLWPPLSCAGIPYGSPDEPYWLRGPRPLADHQSQPDLPESADVENLWQVSLAAARASGLVAEGDRVVITAGTAVNLPGTTDMIKVAIA